jgi:hypothetical protein
MDGHQSQSLALEAVKAYKANQKQNKQHLITNVKKGIRAVSVEAAALHTNRLLERSAKHSAPCQ